MKNRTLFVVMIGLFVLFVSGCAGGFLNEGATKVRLSPVSDSGAAAKFKAIYFKPGDETVDVIEKGQHFSVCLLSAHICGFRESRGLDNVTSDPSNPPFKNKDGTIAQKGIGCTYGGLLEPKLSRRVTRGEITIIANAGESSDTKSHTVNPADSNKKGRVIYYNDDIRESGQLLNAINIPIYGPREYFGKNVFFDLWMLELDNQENKQIKALLSSLAGLGGTAYPPSAPILGILNTLGEAFLSGNQDDVEARFQMRFDVPPPVGDDGTSEIYRVPLSEGYYAFIREENRNINPEWEKFSVNEDLGELCWADANGDCKVVDNNTYRDRTWFLVRIARESRRSALDMEYGEQVSAFLNRLDKFSSADIAETKTALSNLETNLTTLVCNKADSGEKANLPGTCP